MKCVGGAERIDRTKASPHTYACAFQHIKKRSRGSSKVAFHFHFTQMLNTRPDAWLALLLSSCQNLFSAFSPKKNGEMKPNGSKLWLSLHLKGEWEQDDSRPCLNADVQKWCKHGVGVCVCVLVCVLFKLNPAEPDTRIKCFQEKNTVLQILINWGCTRAENNDPQIHQPFNTELFHWLLVPTNRTIWFGETRTKAKFPHRSCCQVLYLIPQAPKIIPLRQPFLPSSYLCFFNNCNYCLSVSVHTEVNICLNIIDYLVLGWVLLLLHSEKLINTQFNLIYCLNYRRKCSSSIEHIFRVIYLEWI